LGSSARELPKRVSEVFVHIAKEDAGALRVLLWAKDESAEFAGGDYKEAFEIINRHMPPVVSGTGCSPQQPLLSDTGFESKAAHYEGLGPLKDQQRPIVSRSDAPLARFSIVRSADEAESEKPNSPFFYSDNEYAFFVEPMVAEVRVQDVKSYGVRTQEPVAFDKDLAVVAKTPRARVEQFERDQHAVFELRPSQDWLADRATVFVFDGRRIGPDGAVDVRAETGGR
jgi:hypothetical protein